MLCAFHFLFGAIWWINVNQRDAAWKRTRFWDVVCGKWGLNQIFKFPQKSFYMQFSKVLNNNNVIITSLFVEHLSNPNYKVFSSSNKKKKRNKRISRNQEMNRALVRLVLKAFVVQPLALLSWAAGVNSTWDCKKKNTEDAGQRDEYLGFIAQLRRTVRAYWVSIFSSVWIKQIEPQLFRICPLTEINAWIKSCWDHCCTLLPWEYNLMLQSVFHCENQEEIF